MCQSIQWVSLYEWSEALITSPYTILAQIPLGQILMWQKVVSQCVFLLVVSTDTLASFTILELNASKESWVWVVKRNYCHLPWCITPFCILQIIRSRSGLGKINIKNITAGGYFKLKFICDKIAFKIQIMLRGEKQTFWGRKPLLINVKRNL